MNQIKPCRPAKLKPFREELVVSGLGLRSFGGFEFEVLGFGFSEEH